MSHAFDEAVAAARTYFQDETISKARLREDNRARDVALVRNWVAAFIRARDPKHYSYPLIGGMLNKHHSSVIHMIRSAHVDFGALIFEEYAPEQFKRIDASRAVVVSVNRATLIARGEVRLHRALDEIRNTLFKNGSGWGVVA